ncbi:MAG: response regulator transcription factor, partial [Deltaproteobacteria bacterium]|nr:response regulator transcription factor [Deltaproteobacteria bacterium]
AEKLFVSVKTIESHYANIKNKLDLKNSHELIQYAVKWCLAEKIQ